MVHLKSVSEGNKESAGIPQTGQATFHLFHINEIRLSFKILTWQSLSHASIFCTRVNNNCHHLVFFSQVRINLGSFLAVLVPVLAYLFFLTFYTISCNRNHQSYFHFFLVVSIFPHTMLSFSSTVFSFF